jgi:hypothetical protein
MNPEPTTTRISRHRDGFVLLVTMIVLVALSTLVTGLSVTLSMSRRRQEYMIEYQRARYGLDSAMKYIINEFPNQRFTLADRQEAPDFSDVFLMDRDEYAAFIADWSATATDEQLDAVLKEGASLTNAEPVNTESMLSGLLALFGGGEQDEATDANTLTEDFYDPDKEVVVFELDPNDVQVPGPYGSPWPLAAEPIELEIGPCRVTITIEDENAKMPLSWLVTDSEEANEQARQALETFCEWMAWDPVRLQELEETVQAAMDKVHDEKMFKLNAGPILEKKTTPAARPSAANPRSRRRTVRGTQTAQTTQTTQTTTTEKRPAIGHTTDFAKLFHSSLLDRELLARPLPDTGERVESPLKYLSLWGAQHVNINTAPRHVLLAAFELATDSFNFPEIAQRVIDKRKEEPFKTLDEFKTLSGFDADTMKTLENYLTTTSTFFKVRVDSRSGSARTSAVATVVKEGRNTQVLMILYEP